MKRRILAFALTASLGVAGLWAADRPAERQKNQQKRIKEGVESGELTQREARKIQQKERQLHREVRRDRADGRGLTPAERAKIEAQQDALSAKIAKEKHDAQKAKK